MWSILKHQSKAPDKISRVAKLQISNLRLHRVRWVHLLWSGPAKSKHWTDQNVFIQAGWFSSLMGAIRVSLEIFQSIQVLGNVLFYLHVSKKRTGWKYKHPGWKFRSSPSSAPRFRSSWPLPVSLWRSHDMLPWAGKESVIVWLMK